MSTQKKEDLGAMSNATSINELMDKALNRWRWW